MRVAAWTSRLRCPTGPCHESLLLPSKQIDRSGWFALSGPTSNVLRLLQVTAVDLHA